MDASRTQCYHLIKFLPTQNDGLSEVVCIPASWIIWEDKECTTVLTAYPVEPLEITRERIKNYENPREDWNSYLAQVRYSTDFYDNVIHCVNQRERMAEESSDSQVIVTEVGRPHCSYSSEYQKWLNSVTNSIDPNCSMVNRTDEFPRLQYESPSSVIDLDSDDDVPQDLSMSSPESRCINEREDGMEELYYPEVIITEVGNPDCSSSSCASQHLKTNDSNTFSSGFHRWFLDLPNLGDPRLSMINRADEVPKMQCKAFETVINQKIKDGDDDDVSRDWCISSSETDQLSGASSLLEGSLTNDRRIDNRWTLKYRERSPGLIELWPNTGAYITEAELNHCLRRSRKCTQLARLLTMHIFSQSALRKCRYINSKFDGQDLRLDVGATTAIVNFVLTYGRVHNWRRSSNHSVKNAMRYQLFLAKKDT